MNPPRSARNMKDKPTRSEAAGPSDMRGGGARRALHRLPLARGPRVAIAEQPSPLRPPETRDARPADRGVPEEIVVEVRGRRGPYHERRVECYPFQEAQRSAAQHLIAPDDERAADLEPQVEPRDIVSDQIDSPRIGDPQAALVAHPEVGNGHPIGAP